MTEPKHSPSYHELLGVCEVSKCLIGNMIHDLKHIMGDCVMVSGLKKHHKALSAIIAKAWEGLEQE